MRKFVKTMALALAMLFAVSTGVLAAEMTCAQADNKSCTMATTSDGKEHKVHAAGAKVGDKLTCNAKRVCKKQ